VLVLSFSAPATTATPAVEGAIMSLDAEKMLRPSPADGTAAPRAGEILKEIGKQAIDQPAHFLIAAAPIWLSRHLVGVPWFGWAAAPLLAYREWQQWPSKRWWDPPLDWAFLIIGVVVATWSRGLARIVLSLPQSIRQARRSRGRGAAMRHDVRPGAGGAGRCFGRALSQWSSRTRMPPTTRTMPATSIRFGRSWNRKTEAAKVNKSSIWPSART
jgi:hypothetical protein